MPPVKVWCPTHGDSALDHFDSCDSPPAPLPWLTSIVRNRLDDSSHADGKLSITRLLGCPRQSLIADFLPYTLNPLNSNSPHVGTMVHAEIERFTEPRYCEVEMEGELFGVHLRGRADYVNPPLIADYKFHGDRSMDYKRRNPLDDDLVAQLNMARLLYEQHVPHSVKHLEVWHGAMTPSGIGPWLKVEVPLRDETWIANVRPKRGSFTVAQIAGFWQQFMSQPLRDARTLADLVPAVGKTMMPAKDGTCQMCPRYCMTGIKTICDDLEKRTGW